ncbi:MAG: HD domain-containing protein [Nitrosopumilus sp.]|nr:HD domain-containing protein [Nitrosopumilus sp.]MDF2424162.1 HD domain-containing protein [Nitrosopumilus sp.]MDF2425965.1 HD domain-containing protein [Nitrosopumilus sp.]MDF2427565.1 HD domain-containing protein [Nitrosopumilus sp.]MDF2428592.1 HD domain-containing protein [Nitrosopumilus sp.]
MVLDFFKTAVNLKKIQRKGWVDRLSISNPESVADHSYSMAVMGMVISDLEGYDSEKIIKMILLHDLAESEIGDHTPGQIPAEKKKDLENKAFLKISESLPDQIKSKYLSIWKEYQENCSQESRMVHQLDRLEMALQAKAYESEGHPKEKLESFFESAKNDITNPKLKELLRKIVGDA